ncbi:ABC transporter ATP-binding protein, partial [Rhizobium ruizarguesonis]
IQREMGSSFLFVTQYMGVHATVSDRNGIVYAGRLGEEAPTAKLFSMPQHPNTQHLVRSLPRIGDPTARPSLEGRQPN